MKNTVLTIFVLGLISCLPEGFSEMEIEPNSRTREQIERYEALYGAKNFEIVLLKADSSVNALAIKIIDADRVPDGLNEKRKISHQIASDIFNTLDKEIIDGIQFVDFGFKKIEVEILTYNKSSIEDYRFVNKKGKLIPVFSSH